MPPIVREILPIIGNQLEKGFEAMSITASSLFGATSAASTASFKTPAAKPVAASAAPAEGAWKTAAAEKPSSAIKDKVDLSPLAKELKGVAADVYAALGSKAKSMLDGFAKSNKMTTEEISLGLRAMATSALYNRFTKERPRDAEDMELQAQGKLLHDAADRREARVNAASDKMMELSKPNMEKLSRIGEGSAETFVYDPEGDALRDKQMEALHAEMEAAWQEERDTVGGDPGKAMGALMGASISKNEKAFKAADFGDTGDGFLSGKNEKADAAKERFYDLGFRSEIFSNGLQKFVANVDIPGVGKGTYTEDPEKEPAAPDPEPEEKITSDATTMLDQAAKNASMISASKGMAGMGKVTKDARAALDAGYLALSSDGKAADVSGGGDEVVTTLFAGLDRRSLFAVASNSGGLFSDTEQKSAQNLMARQQNEAMKQANPTGTDAAAGLKAGIAFLDGVSEEEKASANWSVQRAAAQLGYENTMRAQDKVPLLPESSSPIVRMIKGAMQAKTGETFESMAGGGYVKNLSDMPLFRKGVPSVMGYLTMPVDVKI